MAIGTGLTTAPATQSVLASLPPAQLGAGSAVNNAMRNLGSVLGVAVLGSLAATFYSRGLPAQAALAAHHPLPAAAADAFVRGVSLGAFGAAGLTIAVAATTAWLLPGKLIHTLFQEESLAAAECRTRAGLSRGSTPGSG